MTTNAATTLYLEPPSIPVGMTVADYRRARAARERHRWRRLLR
jgi:hypothetical protein